MDIHTTARRTPHGRALPARRVLEFGEPAKAAPMPSALVAGRRRRARLPTCGGAERIAPGPARV
jgi:hypothetical protein